MNEAIAITPSGEWTRDNSPAPSTNCGPGEVENPVAIEVLDPLEDRRWESELRVHAQAGVFHGSAWARVLCRTYRHRPFYLLAQGGGGVSALLPLMEVASPLTGRRGVCLPFSDAAGPLTSGEIDSSLLVSRAIELGESRRWRYLEIRGAIEVGEAPSGSANFVEHHLDLTPGWDTVKDGFSSSVHRAVRKAGHEGLEARVLGTAEAVSTYEELHAQTRRRHGLPPQPSSFFSRLYDELIGRGNGFVILVESGGRAVAGAVFLWSGSSAVYKFGASDAEAWPLRPNNLAMWEAIRTLCEAGMERLSFGRSDAGDEGLRRFKRSWGAEERPLDYHSYDFKGSKWISTPAGRRDVPFNVFRHLPLSLNKLAGRVLYPHLD